MAYQQIRRDLGDTVLLTSGVRGLAKQYHLFLTKTVETRGNLSQAARSLAPPGYSFHAVGDFDIGKLTFDGRQKLLSVHFGHDQIRENHREVRLPQLRKGLFAVCGGGDSKSSTFKNSPEAFPMGGFVIHNQYSDVAELGFRHR